MLRRNSVMEDLSAFDPKRTCAATSAGCLVRYQFGEPIRCEGGNAFALDKSVR